MLAISENIGRYNEEPFGYSTIENAISEIKKKITEWA